MILTTVFFVRMSTMDTSYYYFTATILSYSSNPLLYMLTQLYNIYWCLDDAARDIVTSNCGSSVIIYRSWYEGEEPLQRLVGTSCHSYLSAKRFFQRLSIAVPYIIQRVDQTPRVYLRTCQETFPIVVSLVIFNSLVQGIQVQQEIIVWSDVWNVRSVILVKYR